MADFIDVVGLDDLEDGQAKVFTLQGERIALCRVGQEVHAIQDICTHDNGPLGDGCLNGYEIECPRHGARFDIRNGKATRMPAVFPLKYYAVQIENQRVMLSLEEIS